MIHLNNEDHFTLLWNPGHVARLKWVPWADGTGDTNFPSGVVQSDTDCKFKVGRHMGQNARGIFVGGFHVK